MILPILCASLVVLISGTVFGQEATTPAFEVASVKPTAPRPDGGIVIGMNGGPGTADPGRINYVGVPLKRLLIRAYGVKNSEIVGPDWLDTERYDIVAKLPAGATTQQFPIMLQNLLAERFQLKVHREKNEVPVYALVIAKGGPKFKESEASAGAAPHGGTRKSFANGVFHLVGTKESMPRFAEALAAELGWRNTVRIAGAARSQAGIAKESGRSIDRRPRGEDTNRELSHRLNDAAMRLSSRGNSCHAASDSFRGSGRDYDIHGIRTASDSHAHV